MSRMQIWRLAESGRIPGARKSKGGQFYFVECPALGEWIVQRRVRQSLRPETRWRESLNNARLSDGPRVKLATTAYADLTFFLMKQPPEFWTKGRREIWRELLQPLVEFYGRL